MNEVPITTFHEAIRAMHGGNPRLVERVRVEEDFDDERVWEGEVLVFALDGHPMAKRCFAWEVDGEVTAVLGEGPIRSARDAVRASIAAG